MDVETIPKDSPKTGLLHQPKMNQTQAARAIGVSVETFRRWRKEAKLPQPLKMGGSLYWLERDLEQWLIDQNPHLEFQLKLLSDLKKVEEEAIKRGVAA